jgi:hypothetical protein
MSALLESKAPTETVAEVNYQPSKVSEFSVSTVKYQSSKVSEPSVSTASVFFIDEAIPSSFLEALEDFNTGRVFNMEQALNEPPPADA